ncbi:MAG TPA: pilus assembly protein PilP [Myxococcaceae bacterium]|nr:pilus assembly protein PilP [Myxococcaceae bacterium]
MIRFSPLLAAALIIAVLGGCASAPPPPAPAPAPAPKVAVAAARENKAPEAPPYVYSYNPLAKRDPFRSLVEEVRAPSAENSVCTEPLCQWDLDQLILVGVVTGEANPLAMVEDPGGRGHLIRRSSRMGKQGGKVTHILRDAVTVTEFWTGPDGKINPNPVTLHMKADKALVPDLDLASGKKYP